MAEQSTVEHDNDVVNEGASFPYVPVIISAVVLIAIGAFFLNLGIGGALPTGFGLGDALPENMVGGVDLDLVRGIIIVVVLAVIAVAAFVMLRGQKK